MTVENISWSISTKECCRPRRGLNPRPPGLQSDGASNWATEAGGLLHLQNTKTLLINSRLLHLQNTKMLLKNSVINCIFKIPKRGLETVWFIAFTKYKKLLSNFVVSCIYKIPKRCLETAWFIAVMLHNVSTTLFLNNDLAFWLICILIGHSLEIYPDIGSTVWIKFNSSIDIRVTRMIEAMVLVIAYYFYYIEKTPLMIYSCEEY